MRHQTSDFYGPSLPDHEPPSPKPLDYALHNPPPPAAVVHTKFSTGPPPPLSGAFQPPPPQGKKAPRKTQTNCTLVADSSVCDNFNLILILVV